MEGHLGRVKGPSEIVRKTVVTTYHKIVCRVELKDIGFASSLGRSKTRWGHQPSVQLASLRKINMMMVA